MIIAVAVIGITFAASPRHLGNQVVQQSSEYEEGASAVVVEEDYVRYFGREGVTAFELLHEIAQVDAQQFSFGVMVNAINGIYPPEGYFWKLYINGEEAQVGADQLQTHSGDVIEWELEAISI